jgi:hypothetical protein
MIIYYIVVIAWWWYLIVNISNILTLEGGYLLSGKIWATSKNMEFPPGMFFPD